MKRFVLVLFSSLLCSVYVVAQPAATKQPAATTSSAATKHTIFRATKGQIKQAQTKLKDTKLYTGDVTGALNDATRASLKSYQKDNSLKVTGTLNRTTLEKMGIELTEAQKAIPGSTTSTTAKTGSSSSSDTKTKRVIFRATKDQIKQAQKMLKSGGMYSGEDTGSLDDATRAGLKKYQKGNGLKVTGTLNQVTLEKMGIGLTDRQKETSSTAIPK